MRTVGVITTSRADYGIYRPLLQKLHSASGFKLKLFVSGSHLEAEHGGTVKEIESDGYPVAARLKLKMDSRTARGIAEAMGTAATLFAKAYDRVRLDLLIALGDRYEMHAAVAASVPYLIPVAHIAGGVVTEGAIDENFRHSITKMSHLHFAETQVYANRILQMGEEPWRVHVCGALGLDNVKSTEFFSWDQLKQKFHIPFSDKPLMVTFHPETKSVNGAAHDVDELLKAVSRFDMPIVFTAPNADTNGQLVREKFHRYVRSKKNACLVPSFGQRGYFSLMKHSRAMVGNSSSGLVEAPSFALPVINVGNRQGGRLAPSNVISVNSSAPAIVKGISQALNPIFKRNIVGLKNPYGDGNATNRIFNVIKKIPLDRRLLIKKFCDTSFRKPT